MDKATILIVDDTAENIDIFRAILGKDYKIKVANNGQQALALAPKITPDLILLDVMMPDMNGYEVCQCLKQDPLTSHIPIIFATALRETAHEEKGFEIGGVDYITKPVSAPVVKARVRTHISLQNQRRLLNEEVKKQTKNLEETRFEILRLLGRAAEYKDNETGLHIIRVSHYAKILAKKMDLPEQYCENIYYAAAMHDVGKIGTPDAVLKKQGKLNKQEWEIMKQHALIGAEIIGQHNDPLLQMAYNIPLTHHEKWNGSGYPRGLQGEEIPLEGRIVAIADVFDALTSERPYKKAWTVDDAMELITREAGKHFDPKLVKHFQEALSEVIEIHDIYTDEK